MSSVLSTYLECLSDPEFLTVDPNIWNMESPVGTVTLACIKSIHAAARAHSPPCSGRTCPPRTSHTCPENHSGKSASGGWPWRPLPSQSRSRRASSPWAVAAQALFSTHRQPGQTFSSVPTWGTSAPSFSPWRGLRRAGGQTADHFPEFWIRIAVGRREKRQMWRD